MDSNPETFANSLISRAKAIILRPAEEWPKIAAEDTTTREVLTGYIIPLALIAPIAGLIGGQVFGYGAFGFSYRPGLISALIGSVVAFFLALISFLALALIADFLSPKFGGETSNQKSFKLVAYASTASWLAGIFALVPALGFFGLLGLYSIYLLYAGATPMLNVPKDKAIAYTAVVFLCAIALNLAIGALSAANMRMLSGMGLYGETSAAGGTLSLPGGGKIDVGAAEKFGKQMEDAATGKSPPVALAKLQALLPNSLGSYARTETSSGSVGQLGSTAEGKYESGDHYINLKIIDMSAMGAIAGMGAAMGVEQNRETADSYERTGVVDGQMRMEEWNRSSGSGRYAVMVGSRFMIEAQGNAASIDELKSAVATVDQDDLKGLVE